VAEDKIGQNQEGKLEFVGGEERIKSPKIEKEEL